MEIAVVSVIRKIRILSVFSKLSHLKNSKPSGINHPAKIFLKRALWVLKKI